MYFCAEEVDPVEEHGEGVFEVKDFLFSCYVDKFEFFFVGLPLCEQELLDSEFEVCFAIFERDVGGVDGEKVFEDAVRDVAADLVDVWGCFEF